MKKFILTAISIVFCFTVIFGGWTDNLNDYFNSQSPSVGMSFLKVGMGARAVALGGAYSPVVKDPTAVYWNPSGVIFTKGLDVHFSHVSLMEDITYEFVAVSTGDEKQGIGFGMGGVFYGDMEVRGEQPSEEPEGTFNAYSFLSKVSYGRKFGRDIVAGISLGGILEKIYIYSTHTYTIDFGMLYFLPIVKPTVLSLNVNNLGPKVIYIDETFRLPLTAKIGVSYPRRILKSDMIFSGEVAKSIDSPLAGALGVESNFPYLSFRLGYQYNDNNIQRFSGGIGIRYSFLSLDYTIAPYLMDLGLKHCVSLNLDF